MDVEAYDRFAKRVLASDIILDPWLFGAPRFRSEPIVLSAETAALLAKVAEDVVETFHEACLLVDESDGVLDTFFGMSPAQKTMWLSSKPFWHGLARVDVFMTSDGPVIAELNCDTPTGEAEAIVLGGLAKEDRPALIDPNEGLRSRFLAMLDFAVAASLGASGGAHPKTVGLVYPTEFTEDLSLVRLYRGWLEAAGWGVVLGSPYNLTDGDDGRVHLMGTPISVMLRHYKTDWWGERASPWTDEDIPDAAALEAPLRTVLRAELEGRLAVLNPFGSVLPQNKRMMAFLWEHIHRLSPKAARVVEAHVPVTRRLENVHEEQLFAQKDESVIKSDYGAEGDEVVIGRLVTTEQWEKTIVFARPGRWVAQRYFDAERTGAGETTNLGVYVVAGQAAGLYARTSPAGTATDAAALSVPVLVAPAPSPSP
ncbi:MAG: glutathionylspermidine synthase family protein [Myxococcales bacterium]|nr:glutathionylspermidine synthase family protein [Myxococcales bacterium]